MTREITASSADPLRSVPLQFFRDRWSLKSSVHAHLDVEIEIRDKEVLNPSFSVVFEDTDSDGEETKLAAEFEDSVEMVPLLRGYDLDLKSFLDDFLRPPLLGEIVLARLLDGKIEADLIVTDGHFLLTYTVDQFRPNGETIQFETKLYIPEADLLPFLVRK